jgi:large subunit ribosomal protein L18
MNTQKLKIKRKNRRKSHVRKKVFGTPARPRLAVFRSNRHIYCQVIDDISGRTLASAGSMDKDLRAKAAYGGNVKTAQLIGEKIAERTKAAGVQAVVFDRRGFRFHGRVKALAESARKAGLKF